MADEQQKPVPPYLPYKTLISSLDNLGQGIPPKLDRSIWKNQPGSVQSQILGAYKFLGLMNDTTNPTQELRKLVENRQSPTDTLRPILEAKYAKIIAHDLTTMTTTMMSSVFETELGVEGETKKKAIRFFLQAAKANGFTLSKFLLDQTRVSSGTRKRKSAKREAGVEGDDLDFEESDENGAQASGTRRVITLRSGGQLSISLSVDLFALSSSDRQFVFGLIDSLQAYEAGAKEGSPT